MRCKHLSKTSISRVDLFNCEVSEIKQGGCQDDSCLLCSLIDQTRDAENSGGGLNPKKSQTSLKKSKFQNQQKKEFFDFRRRLEDSIDSETSSCSSITENGHDCEQSLDSFDNPNRSPENDKKVKILNQMGLEAPVELRRRQRSYQIPKKDPKSSTIKEPLTGNFVSGIIRRKDKGRTYTSFVTKNQDFRLSGTSLPKSDQKLRTGSKSRVTIIIKKKISKKEEQKEDKESHPEPKKSMVVGKKRGPKRNKKLPYIPFDLEQRCIDHSQAQNGNQLKEAGEGPQTIRRYQRRARSAARAKTVILRSSSSTNQQPLIRSNKNQQFLLKGNKSDQKFGGKSSGSPRKIIITKTRKKLTRLNKHRTEDFREPEAQIQITGPKSAPKKSTTNRKQMDSPQSDYIFPSKQPSTLFISGKKKRSTSQNNRKQSGSIPSTEVGESSPCVSKFREIQGLNICPGTPAHRILSKSHLYRSRKFVISLKKFSLEESGAKKKIFGSAGSTATKEDQVDEEVSERSEICLNPAGKVGEVRCGNQKRLSLNLASINEC